MWKTWCRTSSWSCGRRRIGTTRSGGKEATFVAVLTRRRVIDRLRRRGVRPDLRGRSLDAGPLPAAGPDPAAPAELADEMRCVSSAMARLKPDQQRAPAPGGLRRADPRRNRPGAEPAAGHGQDPCPPRADPPAAAARRPRTCAGRVVRWNREGGFVMSADLPPSSSTPPAPESGGPRDPNTAPSPDAAAFDRWLELRAAQLVDDGSHEAADRREATGGPSSDAAGLTPEELDEMQSLARQHPEWLEDESLERVAAWLTVAAGESAAVPAVAADEAGGGGAAARRPAARRGDGGERCRRRSRTRRA